MNGINAGAASVAPILGHLTEAINTPALPDTLEKHIEKIALKLEKLSSWKQILKDTQVPDLEFPSLNIEDFSKADLGSLIAATLVLGLRSTFEISGLQSKRLKLSQGDFVKINERMMELVDERREKIEEMLAAQEKKGFLGFLMAIFTFIASIFTLGAATGPLMALTATVAAVNALNDLTDGQLFEKVLGLDPEAARMFSMALNIISSAVMVGASVAGSFKGAINGFFRGTTESAEEAAKISAKSAYKNAAQHPLNVADEAAEESVKASVKSAKKSHKAAQEVAANAAKTGAKKSFQDIAKIAEKQRQALKDRFNFTQENFLIQSQQAEVLLGIMQALFEMAGNIKDFDIRKFEALIEITKADGQLLKADFTKLQSETELLLERYESNTQEGIVERTEQIAELVDIFLNTDLAHLRKI